MTKVLLRTNHPELAKQIQNDDWRCLKEASKIYTEYESPEITSFDIQTLQMGMSLIPTSKDDAIRIIRSLSSDTPVILSFMDNPSPEKEKQFLEVKMKLSSSDEPYSSLIMDCISFLEEDDLASF